MCAVDVVPPTVFLPLLKQHRAYSEKEISNAIASLRHIYLPEVRGSSRRRHESHSLTATARASNLTLNPYSQKGCDFSAIRADPFERTFAIQWLTRFVSLYSEAICDSPLTGLTTVRSQALLEEAAALLAICAGSAASGTVTRTFTFPLSSGDVEVAIGSPGVASAVSEVSVTLRDAPLESSDFTSVGAQTWGGSCILAEMIAENPQNFSIYPREEVTPSVPHPHINASFRALELGAGTGLASLVLGKVLGRIRGVQDRFLERTSLESARAAAEVDTVVATDFHLSVLANLQLNFAVNFPAQFGDDMISQSSQTLDLHPNMVVLPLDWSVIHLLAGSTPSPRIGSSDRSLDIHISTQAEDTSNVHHYDTLDADTPFQSQPQTRALPQAEIMSGQQQFHSDADADHDVLPTASSSSLALAPELDTPFDLIIGADIIYEQSHARWVHSCLERFLRKPKKHCYTPSSLSPVLTNQYCDSIGALFHLVIPLRRTHAVECHSVEDVFSRAADVLLSRQLSHIEPAKSSNIRSTGDSNSTGIYHYQAADTFMDSVSLKLAIISQEDIWCDAYSDREEEDVVYRYYQIGWV